MTRTGRIVAGIDTHKDTHHVAVIDEHGKPLGDRKFPTTATGYDAIIEYLARYGETIAVGIEGTGSYGAELTRRLMAADVPVVEAGTCDRAVRRLRGKTDQLDAYAAAAAVLSGRATATPKTRDGLVEAIRVLRVARGSAIKARTTAISQIKAILAAAPDAIRAEYRDLTLKPMLDALAAQHQPDCPQTAHTATICALATLAARHQQLNREITQLDQHLDQLTQQIAPGLRAVHGVGPEACAQLLITAGDNPHRITTEAGFAALTGTAPVPASSGKTSRHRLSRGGDRAANAALHHIALARATTCPRTHDYIQRRTAQGKTRKEIMRCLKRFIAREIYHHLTNPQPAPPIDDLRTMRKAAGYSITTAARHLGISHGNLSNLELGKTRNPHLQHRYRQWLTTITIDNP
jgi:transposase